MFLILRSIDRLAYTLVSNVLYIMSCISQDGRTPLHVAAEYGYYDTVKVLLSSGATVDLADKVSI